MSEMGQIDGGGDRSSVADRDVMHGQRGVYTAGQLLVRWREDELNG